MINYFFVSLFILVVTSSIAYAGDLSNHTGKVQFQQSLSYSLDGDPLSSLIMTQGTDYTLTVTNTSGKVLPNFLVSTSVGYIDRTDSTCLTTVTLQAGASCVLIFDIPPEGTVHYVNGSIEFFSSVQKNAIGVFPAFVQPLTWVADNKGLKNSNIFLVTAADSRGIIYFAMAEGKVFKSNSADNQWVAFNKGLPPSSFPKNYLHIHRIISVNGSVYLLTEKHGVFVTNNDSNSWTSDNAGLGNEDVYYITANNNMLYAGTSDGKVYEKTTGAKTGVSQWHYVSSVPGKQGMNGVNSLFVLNHIIYAGTDGSGLYKSVDNGKSWIPTGLSVKNKEGVKIITSIVSLKNTLFVGTSYKGILKSTDNGKTWQQVNHGIDTSQYGQTVWKTVWKLIAFGGSLYADIMLRNLDSRNVSMHIYQSSDEGKNWKNIANEKSFIITGMILVMSKGLLYINPQSVNSQGGDYFLGIYRQQIPKQRKS